MLRKIVKIDEEKCDGCGQCVPACQEGAIQIIDGKARVVSETYCDGLGACLGTCPQDAISIEQREAEAFDPVAVEDELARRASDKPTGEAPPSGPFVCPGAAARQLRPPRAIPAPPGDALAASQLANWPVQLGLVPPLAQYFDNADLLVAADCVSYAVADFHHRLLAGKVLLIACPKLDDVGPHVQKLAAIFADHG